MVPAWLSFFDALLAVVLVLAGMVSAHFYFAPPFLGFQIFVFGFLLGLVGFILGLIGLLMTRSGPRAAARPRALLGTIFSLVVAIPILLVILSGGKAPAINDITTDFDNPPEFEHAAQLPANQGRDMKYDTAKYAARQLAGYGPLEPLKLPAPPDAAFAKVEATAKMMPKWEVTAVYPDSHTLEGVATSTLFHFHDDFVIQVRPAPDGSGSLVEMRSKSRDGIGDFGVNYRRITTFFNELSSAAPAPVQ